MDTNVVNLKLVFLLFFPCLWTPHVAKWVYITATGDSLNPSDTLNSLNYIVSAKRRFVTRSIPRITLFLLNAGSLWDSSTVGLTVLPTNPTWQLRRLLIKVVLKIFFFCGLTVEAINGGYMNFSQGVS